jgi:hypothetical protein
VNGFIVDFRHAQARASLRRFQLRANAGPVKDRLAFELHAILLGAPTPHSFCTRTRHSYCRSCEIAPAVGFGDE